MPSDSWMHRALELRSVIACLGEQPELNWWRSRATTDSGRAMLSLLFPRTVNVGAITLAWQAARREQDRRLGSAGAFHLFRLPTTTEDQLQRLLHEPDLGMGLTESIATFDLALRALRDFGAVDSAPAIEAGPRHFGSIVSVERSERTLREIAAIYLAGVEQRVQVLPYFSEPGA